MIGFKAHKKNKISKKASKSKQEQCITITSALPYVNGVKHLGNLVGSMLPADIFHRFMDAFGVPNIYICGTDEHGTPTEIAAAEEGMTPKEYSEKYHMIQKEIYHRWGFDFSFFGRTSSKNHHDTTRQLFLVIDKNGFITSDTLTLPYCQHCKKYLPDRFIEGTCPKCGYQLARGDQCENCGKLLDPMELENPHCNICKKNDTIIFKKEKHLFLNLTKVQDDLKKWVSKNKYWSPNVRNFALGWINEGLKPRCITRNLSWGIPVPKKGYEHLVFYVWFDAPIGYISMTKDWAEHNKTGWEKWWLEGKKPKIYHFLGKDNIPFHTVIWPSILIAGKSKKTNFSLPYDVVGYEYLNWEGQKFSTSRRIGLFSDEALRLFPADYWRYYLSSVLPEKKDSNFEWDDFQKRINNELIANYGNLFYRVTSFIVGSFGYVPRPNKPASQEKELVEKIKQSTKKVEKLVRDVRLRDALKEMMALSDETNRYFQNKEPWFSIKNKTTRGDAATTVYYAVNATRTITTMLKPYIPRTAEHALECLKVEKRKLGWKNINDFLIKPGHKISTEILFEKIKDEEIEAAKRFK
ncbi:MAG: methionine--tRNA ligase [Candidatus Aenigmarchaeota archaeon]|nr:methionine--tRNA ligase [Candidatus Aenigmarchaeota archaeon]